MNERIGLCRILVYSYTSMHCCKPQNIVRDFDDMWGSCIKNQNIFNYFEVNFTTRFFATCRQASGPWIAIHFTLKSLRNEPTPPPPSWLIRWCECISSASYQHGSPPRRSSKNWSCPVWPDGKSPAPIWPSSSHRETGRCHRRGIGRCRPYRGGPAITCRTRRTGCPITATRDTTR
jgi:hypothetical protein